MTMMTNWKVCPRCRKVYDKDVDFGLCGCPSCYERNRRRSNNLKEFMSRDNESQSRKITP